MINHSWSGDDFQADDVDPGKDIFALLFLSFFLINAVILLSVSSGQRTTNIENTSGNQKKIIESSMLAKLEFKQDQAMLIQNNTTYHLPADIENLKKKAKFDLRDDKQGQKIAYIIIEDPDKTISAVQTLSVVRLLGDAGIGVDFRPVFKN